MPDTCLAATAASRPSPRSIKAQWDATNQCRTRSSPKRLRIQFARTRAIFGCMVIASSSAATPLVLGASGSVGNALFSELVRCGAFSRVVTLTRRSQADQLTMARAVNVTLREVIVPSMTAESLHSATMNALRDVEGPIVGLSVLGIGAGTAKLTIDEHRAVDVALNSAFARALAESGRATHFALMSAAGANAGASERGSGAAGAARYNRVKGEAEAAVRASGVPVVSIFRPAMIIGSQHTPWLLEKLLPLFSLVTPAKYKSITAQQIAKAMVATSRSVPATSSVYHYPEMIALGR